MSGLFGWDYPPGCSSVPGDFDTPCAVCGCDEWECICPECTVCGEIGRPECYEQHGMVLSEEQKRSYAAAELRWAEDNRERELAYGPAEDPF